jgi:hypothetical protein
LWLAAAPLLLQLARLAPLPATLDRVAGAAVLVAQVAVLAHAAHRFAKGLTADAVEAALFAVTLLLALPAVLVAWLGAAGAARPIPIAFATSVAGAVVYALARTPTAGAPLAAPLRRGERAAIAFAATVILLLTANTIREATRDADSVWYHLTIAAEIVRTGSIRPNPIVTVNAVAYPGAREAVLAWLMTPLRSENPALLFPLEISAAALALFALARSFAVARPAALAVTAILVAAPITATAAVEQKNDLFLALAFLLTAVFLRAFARSGLHRHAVMAGLAAGLLASAKVSGLLLLGLLLLIWIVADRPRLRAALVGSLLGAAALVAAVWYARNLLLFHNPVYPKPIAVLGRALFPGEERVDHQYAQTILGLSPARIARHGGQFVAGLGPALIPALALPVLAALAALRRAPRFRERAFLWLGVLPVLLFALYARLPYSVHPKGTSYWYVQPRFLFSLLALSAVGLAALVPDRGRLQRAGVIALAGLAIAPLPLPILLPAVALAALAALVPARVPRVPASALLALALPAVLALDAYRERVKDDPVHGYRADPVEGWGDVSLWVRGHVRGARILYVGGIQMFPLLGPGLTNTLFWAHVEPKEDEVLAVERAAREHDVDYIVAFAPVKLRHGALGERFDYRAPPTRALRERCPAEMELAFVSGHAEVVRVLKPGACR